jgi:hypothetical protein
MPFDYENPLSWLQEQATRQPTAVSNRGEVNPVIAQDILSQLLDPAAAYTPQGWDEETQRLTDQAIRGNRSDALLGMGAALLGSRGNINQGLSGALESMQDWRRPDVIRDQVKIKRRDDLRGIVGDNLSQTRVRAGTAETIAGKAPGKVDYRVGELEDLRAKIKATDVSNIPYGSQIQQGLLNSISIGNLDEGRKFVLSPERYAIQHAIVDTPSQGTDPYTGAPVAEPSEPTLYTPAQEEQLSRVTEAFSKAYMGLTNMQPSVEETSGLQDMVKGQIASGQTVDPMAMAMAWGEQGVASGRYKFDIEDWYDAFPRALEIVNQARGPIPEDPGSFATPGSLIPSGGGEQPSPFLGRMEERMQQSEPAGPPSAETIASSMEPSRESGPPGFSGSMYTPTSAERAASQNDLNARMQAWADRQSSEATPEQGGGPEAQAIELVDYEMLTNQLGQEDAINAAIEKLSAMEMTEEVVAVINKIKEMRGY